MEKIQIAKYALIQVTGLVYAILLSSAVIKFSQGPLNSGLPMPSSYYWALFMRNYGLVFSLFIMLWTFGVSYYSVYKAQDLSSWWIYSAMVVFALVVGLSSFIAFGTIIGPFLHSDS